MIKKKEVTTMYLRRKIDDYLKNRKMGDNRLPLIVKGARQTGKTESILHFASQYYSNIIYINFALEPKYKSILSDGYDTISVLKNISLLDPSKKFIPNETIIIFDELQECPDIATTLKSFKTDGNYDVICSGSLLGIHYKKIHSNSVGYKMDYEMNSLDFEEFLWAKEYSESQISDILLHMLERKPFNQAEMSVYQSLFLDYCVLGGMPAVVSRYIDTGLFTDSLSIQKQIMLDYEEDVRKYAEGLDQAKILSIYRNVPSQLAKENKKFQFSKLSPSARARDYRGCIEWLKDAGVIKICYCLNYPELPLKGNYDEQRFKIYYPDTGLLISTLDDEAQVDLRSNKNLGVYKGALYENFVAEAFVKQGLGLYYFKKQNSSLEEDFFVRSKNELIPVEVKANTNSSKSLATLIKSKNYSDIKHGIKLSACNIGETETTITFPYFCSFLLKKFINS
jgi:predicted AAA+ superfamily ATPase